MKSDTTTTPTGKLVADRVRGIAEFERAIIRDRITAERVAAKKRGVKFGRSRGLRLSKLSSRCAWR